MNVDIHAHILVPQILADTGSEFWRPRVIPHSSGGYLVTNERFTNGPVFKSLFDPDQIVAAMQEIRIDLVVLSTPPYAFFYDLSPAEGERASAIQNEGLERAVSQHRQHLAGLGTVPLQDVSRAVKELTRVTEELGLSGVEIASNINGEDLSLEKYLPFWEAAESLEAVVFVHPAYFNQLGRERMERYYLRNLLGNPMETAVFAAHLIFSGILESYPKLRIVLAHAGGVLPYLRGRLDHGHRMRNEPKRRISRAPSEYLRMFYYDTLTHHGPTLSYLVDLVGADRVLLGSDYPFDMGYERPVEFVEQVSELSLEDREMILGSNALRLLRRTP